MSCNGDSPDSTTSLRSVRKSGTVPAPHLFIDADGFPNLELALEIAGNHKINTVIAGNYSQYLDRYEGVNGVEIMEVSEGMDAADFAIISAIRRGDVLLTNDTGLAAVALAAGVRVLDARGNEYSEETIDRRLMQRHVSKRIRRSGGRTKGPRKMSDTDRLRFKERLEELLSLTFNQSTS